MWLAFVGAVGTAHRGHATTFDRSDKDAGNPVDTLACKPWRRLRVGEHAVASYALPCGSRLRIFSPRTGKTVHAAVLDRGPRRTRHGQLQDDLDLSAPLALALGSDGFEDVLWWVVEP